MLVSRACAVQITNFLRAGASFMFRGFLKPVLAITLCLLVVGCTNSPITPSGQRANAAHGGSAPIPEVVNDAATEPELRQQLERIIAIREFASSELGLPDNGSYRSYADLGALLSSGTSSRHQNFRGTATVVFIFAGCVNYRGYYDKNDADLYAKELREEGADTYIGGVTAYSTLGYFNDPVLNTFLRFGDQETARIIFHELAHQLIYAKGDSAFNESFATAVENEGMRRWLMRSTAPEQLRDFDARQERKAQFHRLVADNRGKLRAIYASSLTPDAKRSARRKYSQK